MTDVAEELEEVLKYAPDNRGRVKEIVLKAITEIKRLRMELDYFQKEEEIEAKLSEGRWDGIWEHDG